MSVPISIFRIGSNWILSGGSVTLEPTKVCISGSCSEYDEVLAKEDGTWVITPQEIEVRWLSPTTALVKSPGAEWAKASLTASAAVPPPITDPHPLSPTSDRGVLPGLWYRGTFDCDPAKPAWLFEPLQAGIPSVRAIPEGNRWTFDEGSRIVRCTGGKIGAVEGKLPASTNRVDGRRDTSP